MSIYDEYRLASGELTLEDGTCYKSVLFIEIKKDEFTFLDEDINIVKIDPYEISKFATDRIPKEQSIYDDESF